MNFYGLLAAVQGGTQGVTIQLTAIEAAILVVTLVVIAAVLIIALRQYIVNSILGVALLLVLNTIGMDIPLSIPAILITAGLGLVGVALLVILSFFGVKV